MKKRVTLLRFITAVVSMALEQAGIYAVWRWLLPALGIDLPVWVVVLAMSGWLIAGVTLYLMGNSVIGKKALPGISSMIGLEGKTSGKLAPEGMVKINAELWNAVSDGGVIESGEKIIVTGEDGLKLVVRKKPRP